MYKYTIRPTLLASRRGNYKMVDTINPKIWTPSPMTPNYRDSMVVSEIAFANYGLLHEHPYWENEPIKFVEAYQEFYNELFGMTWIHGREDRHNIVVNKDCCLTLVQYHDGVLTAYSRSTDMKNGYWSDKRVLDYLAEVMNKVGDNKVEKIVWYLAVPHVYEKEGIARLING